MRIRTNILVLVVLLCVLMVMSTAGLAANPGEQPAAPAPNPTVVVSPLSSPDPARTQMDSRLQAVREGKWPAQVASSLGNIAPDQHGPQRNDPAEGIPVHAYSPFDEKNNREYPCPPGGCEFEPGQVLVKLDPGVGVRPQGLQVQGMLTADAALNAALAAQEVVALEPLFPQATAPELGAMAATPAGGRMPMPDLTRWQRAILRSKDKDVYATMAALEAVPGIAWAEPNYLRKPLGERTEVRGQGSEVDDLQSLIRNPQSAIGNPLSPATFNDPLYAQQWHLGAVNAPQAWDWLSSQDPPLPPGGDRDIVVAVIDSGVDYTHPDLAANMWINPLEFNGTPGVDDDANGFVDDIHGANVVSNQHSGDPQDDHGHGTHVAGIIAAQAENNLGGVGVAYNVQVMALKAAQYSGVLSTSDIAEAIYYAVEKGADVINMSFGGYARSQVEEDALAVAFGQAVLVAAAGNDAKVNLPCPFGSDMYPAAYNWVLGVMASTSSGSLASFSNTDCTPHDSHEYELMAPGVDVWSTLPVENYAAWDGTSMAAPVVAGIAALLRTKWTDRDVYSSRFIMGQIASNTSGGVADAFAALTVTPQPELSYLEHWLFDTENQSPTNDDDGIVDAGETVDLAIVIRNHWGKADPVTVTLEAWAEGAYQPDPYVTIITDTVNYGAIGSFNWDDNGLIYDDEGVITGVQFPFRFTVPITTPNDHVIPFLLTMTAGNGYDPGDPNAPYTFESRFYLIVQRGVELPRIISEDMVLTKDYYWLVPDQTLIEAGVTVTVTEGTQMQFWSSTPADPYANDPYPQMYVSGLLYVSGTVESPVEMFLDPFYRGRLVEVKELDQGSVHMQYAEVENPSIVASTVDHTLLWSSGTFDISFERDGDIVWINSQNFVAADTVSLSKFIDQGNTSYSDLPSYGVNNVFHLDDETTELGGSIHGSLFQANFMNVVLENRDGTEFTNNTVLNNVKELLTGETRVSKIWISNYWYDTCSGNENIRFNSFLNRYTKPDPAKWARIYARPSAPNSGCLQDNYWGTLSTEIIDASIHDRYDDLTLPQILYQPILTTPATTTYPFVVNVVLSTALDPDATVISAEPVTFTVSFNRDMDTAIQPAVSFGPDVPMTDYTVHPINGGWQNPRTWSGTFNVNPITGDGYQLIRVAGAVAADDPWLVTGDDAGRFRFEVITSGENSMNLQATGGEGYVDLMWLQDDFDLLSGFNLYRATSQDGPYSLVNASIIPPDQRTLRDIDVAPGQPYYYKFTIVKSDMSESDFSNMATATPVDTIPPVIAHEPLTQAPPGLALTVSADVTDNVGVQTVKLFHRAVGAVNYTSQAMVKTTGNRYSATIAGGLVNSPGIEYYIEAFDGISTVRSGRPEYPHQIVVVDRPVVTAISPNRGTTSGGTAVTIAGSNFKAGASVTLGGAVCGAVVVVSTSQITCATPPHFPTVVDVVVTNPNGQSGTLLRGFTYESDTASLSLPDTSGGQNDLVQVPINLANTDGLLAADLTVTFDPAVLSATGARTGSLTPGWSLSANTSVAGRITLSLAGSSTVSASGVLAYLEFTVIGAPGASSPLQPVSVLLNDGAIPVDAADGSFSVNLVYSVAGAVMFWNGGVVSDTLLTIEGDRLYSDRSDVSGAYSINSVPAGDYTLTPSKTDEAYGITAYDASLVLQHAAGIITLNGHAATAADVNKSGAITAMDASYILQKSVELITLPFPGAGVVWEFAPTTRSFTGLSSSQTGQNFTAILLGDVSGNWATPASAQAASPSTAAPARLQMISGWPDAKGLVDVTLRLSPSSTPIHAIDLALTYDPALATLVDTTSPLAAAGMLVMANEQAPGLVTTAMAGALPLATPADIFRLRFQVHDPAFRLQVQSALLDEEAAPLRIEPGPLPANPLYLPMLAR